MINYLLLLKQYCAPNNLLSTHLRIIHNRVIKCGQYGDPYIAASLLGVYAKCRQTREARKVFDEMPKRDVVPWTIIISCYAQDGDFDRAFYMFNHMTRSCSMIQPNSVMILSLLSRLDCLVHVECLHGTIIRHGFNSDIRLENSLLNMYAKLGDVDDAKRLFDGMNERRDVVSWNSIVCGYSQRGHTKEAFSILSQMLQHVNEGVNPDFQTLISSMLSALANKGLLREGTAIHSVVIAYGYASDIMVATSLVGLYCKCSKPDDAMRLFEEVSYASAKDDVLWTTMISGLALNGCAEKSMSVFRHMVRLYGTTSISAMASALAACGSLGDIGQGKSIHAYMIRQQMVMDVAAANSLLSMYAKCSRIVEAENIFRQMPDRDVVSWNAMITYYSQNGYLDEALALFSQMRLDGKCPDSVTVVGLFQACAASGALHQGKWVHSFIIRNMAKSSLLVGTMLIDMYSKCGSVETAMKIFREMPVKDVVSWSVIIAGYGCHGKGDKVLSLYKEMLNMGVRPNHVTFLALLSSYAHSGFVSQGLKLYKSMVEEYGIKPQVEHCACIVDLLCRAGKLREALRFIKSMPMSPTADMFGIVLGACKAQGHEEIRHMIEREILSMQPENAGNLVQLARSYAEISRWDGVAEVWRQMRSLKMKKTPGWSFIEIQGATYTFYAHHTSIPKWEEVTQVLDILEIDMRTNFDVMWNS